MGPGHTSSLSLTESLAFLQRYKGKIAKIARLAGRLRGLAFEARCQQVITGFDPTHVDLVRDPLRLYPTQLAMMSPNATDGLRQLQAARFAEHGLLGWRLTAAQEERGPFVAGVDVSGSMRGTSEIVAKAIALGAAQVARGEGREYRLFSFSWGDAIACEATSRQGWPEHLAWGETTVGGSTDFNLARNHAMQALGDLPHADLLFISDGEAGVNPQTAAAWRAFADKTGARLFYVAVGGSLGYGPLTELADKVYPIGRLTDDNADVIAEEVGRWLR